MKFSGELTKEPDWCIVKESIFNEGGGVEHDVYPHVTDTTYVKYLTRVQEEKNAEKLVGQTRGPIYEAGNEEGRARGKAYLEREEGANHYAKEACCEPEKKTCRSKRTDQEAGWKGLGAWLAYWERLEDKRNGEKNIEREYTPGKTE